MGRALHGPQLRGEQGAPPWGFCPGDSQTLTLGTSVGYQRCSAGAVAPPLSPGGPGRGWRTSSVLSQPEGAGCYWLLEGRGQRGRRTPSRAQPSPRHEGLPSSERHSAEAGNSGQANRFILLGGTPRLLCDTKGHATSHGIHRPRWGNNTLLKAQKTCLSSSSQVRPPADPCVGPGLLVTFILRHSG